MSINSLVVRIGKEAARTRNRALFIFRRIKCVILALFLPYFFSLFALCSDVYARFGVTTDLLDADQNSPYVSRETFEKHRDLSPRGAVFYPMRYKRLFSVLPTPLSIEIPLLSSTQPLTPYISCAFSRCPTPFHAFSMYFCLSSPIFKCFCFISYS